MTDTLVQRCAGLFMVGFPGTAPDDALKRLVDHSRSRHHRHHPASSPARALPDVAAERLGRGQRWL
jgi:hypothetical protein